MTLLRIFGLALIVESVIDGILILVWTSSLSWGDSPSWEGLMIYMLALALAGLVFLFGVLLLFDCGKMLEDKSLYQPSGQTLL